MPPKKRLTRSLSSFVHKVIRAFPPLDFFTYTFRFSGAIYTGIIIFVILAIGIKLFAEIQIEVLTLRIPEIPLVLNTPEGEVEFFIPKVAPKQSAPLLRQGYGGQAYATFSDLFSGIGWIDTDRTTAWHDTKTQSISLPPVYEWNEVATLNGIRVTHIVKGPSASSGQGGNGWLLADENGKIYILEESKRLNLSADLRFSLGEVIHAIEYVDALNAWLVVGEKDGAGKIWKVAETGTAETFLSFPSFAKATEGKSVMDIACVDDTCLLQNGNSLQKFLATIPNPQLHAIALPLLRQDFGGQAPLIQNIGSIGAYWLVGMEEPKNRRTEEQKNETHTSRTYQFNGNSFLALSSLALSSEYPGTISFGGTANDWLAVYGAYEGQGFHFTTIPPNRPGEDISLLFNIRAMEYVGFRPTIVSDATAHYIFSTDRDLPKFLKVERNAAHDLTDALGLNAYEYTLVAEQADQSVLVAAVSGSDTTLFTFINNGFEDTPVEFVSKTINTGPAVQTVTAAMIDRIDGSNLESAEFFLSNDGGTTWLSAKEGMLVEFADTGDTSNLRWRAILNRKQDAHTSPSFSRIQIRYYYKE